MCRIFEIFGDQKEAYTRTSVENSNGFVLHSRYLQEVFEGISFIEETSIFKTKSFKEIESPLLTGFH